MEFEQVIEWCQNKVNNTVVNDRFSSIRLLFTIFAKLLYYGGHKYYSFLQYYKFEQIIKRRFSDIFIFEFVYSECREELLFHITRIYGPSIKMYYPEFENEISYICKLPFRAFEYYVDYPEKIAPLLDNNPDIIKELFRRKMVMNELNDLYDCVLLYHHDINYFSI